MKKINIKRLDKQRIYSTKTQSYLDNKNLLARGPLKIAKNYFRGSNEGLKNDKINVIRKSIKEEEKNGINNFNKTYNNNKPMFHRVSPKNNLNKLNNPKSGIIYNKKIEGQKLPRNISANSISKDSTLYKTKNRFLSSVKLENYKNKNLSMALSPKRGNLNPKNGRSFSAVNINNKNSFKNIHNVKNSNTLDNGGFITALDPALVQNQIGFNRSNTRSENRSYFLRKLNEEKRFLSYFDIQRILFLDRKVYKPDKEFEKKVYDLKNNNSDEFITNFNFDKYKLTILKLFQRQVSAQNYDIMKKNFDYIGRGWGLRDNAKKRRRKRKRNVTSETERELKYNHLKLERETRIREKYGKQ